MGYTAYMSPLEVTIYAIDALLALIVIFLSIQITRASTTYMWHPADPEIQGKMRFIILTRLIVVVALAFTAALLNLSLALFI